MRRIEDDAAWVPCTFDPAEPGSIDMWLGPTARPITQPQLRSATPACRPLSTTRPVRGNVMKPGIQCVQTHWIWGFTASSGFHGVAVLVSGNADAGWRSISATACGTAAGS